MDLFRRPRDDLEKSTICGACLSILTVAFISLLSSLALVEFAKTRFIKNVVVKGSADKYINQFEVNIDIILINSPCETLSIEKKDSVSQGATTIRTGLMFERLMRDKNDIVWEDYVDPEIKKAFSLEEATMQKILTGLKNRERCRISGALMVNKVPGRITITNKKDMEVIKKLRSISDEYYSRLNMAHNITTLTFGSLELQKFMTTRVGGREMEFNSAKGSEFTSDYAISCTYYMKVIPHVYPCNCPEQMQGDDVYKYAYHRQCYVRTVNYRLG